MLHNKKPVGIFGSAFNPLTKAHQYIIEQAKTQVEELWLIPSNAPPHKIIEYSFEKRYSIIFQIYAQDILKGQIKVLDIDNQLLKEGKKASTYNMLLALGPFFEKPLFFVGEDNKNLDNFIRKTEILELAEISEIKLPIELSGIRSTLARNNINNENEILKYISNDVLEIYKQNNKETCYA